MFLNMKVADLKRELKARSLSCKGNKERLRQRLAEAVGNEHDEVEPNDSASQTSTRISTSESLILRQAEEAATRAALTVRLNATKEKQELEKKMAELKRREELMDLEAQVAEVTAREEAIKRFHHQVNAASADVGRLASPAPATPAGPSHAEQISQNYERERQDPSAPVIDEPSFCAPVAAEDIRFARADEERNGPMQDTRRLAQERERTAALMRLPPIEMKKFGGDVTEFAQFMNSFELKIASKLDSDQERLYYLEQNMTSGSKAHAIVTSCVYLEDGYEQAITMLKKRYGQPSNISSAFMDRINSFGTIKSNDVERLDRFALLLLSCKNALGTNAHLMGDPRTMRAITSKLPDAMLNGWRRHADEIEERQARAVTFEDIVKFVGDEARIASNPTYGRLMYSHSRDISIASPSGHRNVVPPSGHRSVNGSTRAPRPLVATTQAQHQMKCVFCDGIGHSTVECEQLRAIPQEQKKAFAMRMALCFSCFKRGHRSSDCVRRATCRLCGRRHPTVMHLEPREESHNQQHVNTRQGEEQSAEQRPAAFQQGTTVSGATVCGTASSENSERHALPLVPVVLCNGAKRVKTFAFLDSGSTHSFATNDVLNEIGMQNAPSRQLSITTVERGVSIPTRLAAGLHITDINGDNEMQLPTLYGMETIPADPSDFPKQDDVRRWDHLKEIEIPEPETKEVGLLLGANAFLAMEPRRVIPSVDGSPFAVLTRFGWVVSGLNSTSLKSKTTVCRTTVKDDEQSIEELVRKMYNSEYEENLHSTKRGLSVEDKEWIQAVESSMKLEDGHYTAPLPMKKPDEKMPNNLKMAEKRLEGLRTRLKRDEKYAADYRKFMEEMIHKGYAEEVADEEHEGTSGRCWYLPHHAVYHPMKPDKIRVVFDCAARCGGLSLNDILLAGPDQTNSLVDVLMRFRMEPVAFTADIEGMFNQVKVNESDRNLIRFLWFENGEVNGPIRHYRMTVHLFGATSSPSVACYALRRAAADASEEFSEECVAAVNENFYVDDLLCSTSTEETAITQAKELKSLCRRGGFNLTKFASNRSAVVTAFERDDRSDGMKTWSGCTDRLPSEKTLGVIWDTEEDLLKLDVQCESLKRKPCTRRGLLSAVSSLYDPLGMIDPTVTQGRRILQELTKKQADWDDELSEEDVLTWNDWLFALESLDSLSIQRCIKPKDFGDVITCQIHNFVDASEAAYGAVSYIRITDEAGTIHCSFLKGKAHLAPLKAITVPRLELMAAVTGVRLSAVVADAMRAQLERWSVEVQEFFWTDSTTVLRYISNRKTRFHTFVANRLSVIHDGSLPSQWRHVPSSKNPADDVSRGLQSDRWLAGPEFLWMPEDHWPEMPGALQVTAEDPEVKVMACAMKTVDLLDQSHSQNPLLKLAEHYSSRHRLLRAIAWIIKVKKGLKDRCKGILIQRRPVMLNSDDIREAEAAAVRSLQEDAFPEENAALKSGKEVHSGSKLIKLSPFIEDGIIKVGGRLKDAAMEYESQHPIILPSQGRYVDLVIEDAHKKAGHAGRQHVLAELRKTFWILKGTATVRRVIGRCLICRRLRAATEMQKMADLPCDRVTAMEPPFTRSGVDYFGPFYVRHGRGQAKRYGVIFTCLSVRCIHIEVAEDLSSDSFICALKRFIARRGNIKILRSDRATNFVGAERELGEELKKLENKEGWLVKEMLAHSIDWKFNTPGASHHGGAWERMIRTVRKILDTMLQAKSLKNETLQTFLCGAESIVNSRPLVPPSSDPFDYPPLSPKDILLIGSHTETVPMDVFSTSDSDHRKMWKQACYLADVFWRRWRQEYLPLLQERPVKTATARKNLEVGDVVLLVDESVPRGQWPIGRIEAVKMSKDNLVRSVTLKVRGVTVERPITKLVKMC